MEPSADIDFLRVLLPLVVVVFIIAIGVFLLNQQFQKNLFRQKLTQEELKRSHQRDLLKSSIEVQEKERKRIARDLHDEMGASLSMARMQLVRLEEALSKDQLAGSIKNVRNIVESTLNSVREISHQLMPPQLEALGLSKTLGSLADQINEGDDLQLQLNLTELTGRLPWFIELGLYRMTLELIQNTLKHADASEAHLSLSDSMNEHVLLTYSDNGKGINSLNAPGMGLKNLEARANALGGNFELKESEGFLARITIPVNEKTK